MPEALRDQNDSYGRHSLITVYERTSGDMRAMAQFETPYDPSYVPRHASESS